MFALLIILVLVFSSGIVEAAACSDPPAFTKGYSLNYMGRHWSCLGYPAGGWSHAIENDVVVNAAVAEITYSTSLGEWLPTNTHTEDLRLNVNGDNKIYCAKGPIPILKAVYRVWGSTSVNIKAHTMAEATAGPGSLLEEIDRIDTFKRQDKTTILVNEGAKVIAAEASLDIERVTWNPADHGFGNSHLRVTNDLCGDYFDVEVWVEEQDEQSDTSRVWMESYIESAEVSFCGDESVDSGEECDEGESNSDVLPDTCRADCTNPICGDGVVDILAGEQCDFGDITDGDGCNSTCQIEVTIPTGEVSWTNANFEAFLDGDYVDLNDYVRLVFESSDFEGQQVDYRIMEVDGGLFWFDSKVADLSGAGSVWKANVSSDTGYYFTAFVDGEVIGTSDVLNVDETPDDAPMTLKIESPLCGDDLTLGDDTGIYVEILDKDDVIDAVLNVNGSEMELTNADDFVSYTFEDAGNIPISLTGTNSRGRIKRQFSNVMVVDKTLYGTYIAACIDKPADFADVTERQIEFEAYGTRAVEFDPTVGNVIELTTLNDKSALMFNWVFSDIDQNTGTFRVRNIAGSNPRAYDFTREYFRSGNNWATLEVNFI